MSGRGKSHCRRRDGAARTHGQCRSVTLIELLVVISIIALLLAILLPSMGKARSRAMRVVCLSNLRVLAFALHEYADENGDWLPTCVQRCGAPGAWRESATLVRHEAYDYDLVKTLGRYTGPKALSCPEPTRITVDDPANRGPVVYSNYIFLWGCDRDTPVTGIERLSQARNTPAVADFTWYNDGPPPDYPPMIGGNHAHRGARSGAAVGVDVVTNPSASQFIEGRRSGIILGMNAARLSGEADWFPRARHNWWTAGPYNRGSATNSFVYLPVWR